MSRPDPAFLGRLTRALADQGASAVKVIASSEIVLDERVRLKCLIPRCESYGRNLMCPPHLPPLADFRQALARASQAVLVQVSAPVPRGAVKRSSEDIYLPAKKLHDLICLGERLAFEEGLHLAIGLIGGPCRLCDSCVGPNSSEPCRHPFRARPPMEGMGIDVMTTVRRAGLPADFPIADRVTWTGCLLL